MQSSPNTSFNLLIFSDRHLESCFLSFVLKLMFFLAPREMAPELRAVSKEPFPRQALKAQKPLAASPLPAAQPPVGGVWGCTKDNSALSNWEGRGRKQGVVLFFSKYLSAPETL